MNPATPGRFADCSARCHSVHTARVLPGARRVWNTPVASPTSPHPQRPPPMAEIARRRLLKLAGGSVALTALSSSIARAASLPARGTTGTIEDVEHIVVLMQENRSFDHYFGTMKGVRGYGDPRPVTLPSGKPVWHQADAAGKEVLPFRPPADKLGLQFLQDLNHDGAGGHRAFNKGAYDQWVPAKTATT